MIVLTVGTEIKGNLNKFLSMKTKIFLIGLVSILFFSRLRATGTYSSTKPYRGSGASDQMRGSTWTGCAGLRYAKDAARQTMRKRCSAVGAIRGYCCSFSAGCWPSSTKTGNGSIPNWNRSPARS